MKKKFNEKLQIPYEKTENGTIDYLGYPFGRWNKEKKRYEDGPKVPNFIFEDTLEMIWFSKGRSSVKFDFKSKTTGNGYEMFFRDAVNLILKGKDLLNLTGKFCFVKQGKNFGVYLLED